MALDKLVDSAQLNGALTSTANKIRAKTGGKDSISWNLTTGFTSAIDSIVTLPEGSDDATATASDILYNKTAYVKGSKVTGSIQNGTITNNTTLPSGTSSAGTVNRGSVIKIGAGYYGADSYYTAQANSGTKPITASGNTNVDGYTTASVPAIDGSIGGSASSGSATAVITNVNSMNTISDLSGKTAGTDYWTVKATATGAKGTYTPKYTVSTAGWLASTVTGTAQDVSVSSDTTGKSIYIPKATFAKDGAKVYVSAGGYIPTGSTSAPIATIGNGTVVASVSANTGGSASMAATGFTAASSATDYYVTLSTSAGSVKAHAAGGTAGYVTSSTTNETAATSVAVSGNGNKLYVPAGEVGPSLGTPSVTAPTATGQISGTGTDITVTTKPSGTDGTDYWEFSPYVDKTNGSCSATASLSVSSAGYIPSDYSSYLDVKTRSIVVTASGGTKYYLTKGVITNNTSGGTSSGTVNRGNQIKIGKGYYPADVYYTAQPNSGTITITGSGDTTVNGYVTASVAAAVAAANTASASIATSSSDSSSITIDTSAPGSGAYYTLTASGSGSSKITTAGWIGTGALTAASTTKAYYINRATTSVTNGTASATANAGTASIAKNPSASASATANGIDGGYYTDSTTSSYYIDCSASAASGYSTATGGSASASVTASSATVGVGYNPTAVTASTTASSTGNKTGNTVTSTEKTATANQKIYLKAAGISWSGGGLTNTANYSGTPTVGIALDSQTTSGIEITDTAQSSGYYIKLVGSSSALSGTTTVTRAAYNETRTAGYLPARVATTILASDTSSPTVTVSAGSKTRYLTIPTATFANSATSGRTYTDISSSAPVLVAGNYLYINKGWTPDCKISLARLVPDGSDVKGHTEYIISGHSAYDNDGTLVAGSIPTLVAGDVTVSENVVTIPLAKYTGASGGTAVTKTIGVGTVTSGSATISSVTFADGSDAAKFNMSGSANVSAPSVGTAGYISSTKGTRNANNGGATLSATVNKIVGSASIAATTKVPSITKQNVPSGCTQAASGNATTTAPTSGVYVAVQSAANTATLTPTVSITTSGYGTSTKHGISATGATVGAAASAMTYIPITTATPAFTGGGLSGTATASSSTASISDSANNSGVSFATACTTTRANVTYNGAVNGWVTQSSGATALSSTSTAMTAKTYYVNAVSIAKPSSGTRTFTVTAPDGNNVSHTYLFTVDNSGNTTIKVDNTCTLQWNTTDQSLDFIYT